MKIAILEAPSVLGLWPSGVEDAPAALLRHGLRMRLDARHAGVVTPPAYNDRRDPRTAMLNPQGVSLYARSLADALSPCLSAGEFPLVLGGDCSILLGPMSALRRRGRYGLLFLDGHADFYPPEFSPTGEGADMELALLTGHFSSISPDVEGLGPFVEEQDVVAFGPRDREAVAAGGAPALASTSMKVLELDAIRREGLKPATDEAIDFLSRTRTEGFWIHFDVDVLNDSEMPAVDYRQAGGLSFTELETVLRAAIGSGKACGMTLTIFNPRLDPQGAYGSALVELLGRALRS